MPCGACSHNYGYGSWLKSWVKLGTIMQMRGIIRSWPEPWPSQQAKSFGRLKDFQDLHDLNYINVACIRLNQILWKHIRMKQSMVVNHVSWNQSSIIEGRAIDELLPPTCGYVSHQTGHSNTSGHYHNIKKTFYPSMDIPMLRIRWSMRQSYLQRGNPYTGKTASLDWDSPPDHIWR